MTSFKFKQKNGIISVLKLLYKGNVYLYGLLFQMSLSLRWHLALNYRIPVELRIDEFAASG